MEVQLTPDQKAFVRRAIASGRLQREEDAVREALSLWEERERRRLEILVAVDRAESSFARGEGRSVTTEGEVRQLCRRRKAARHGASERRAQSGSKSDSALRVKRRPSVTTCGCTSCTAAVTSPDCLGETYGREILPNREAQSTRFMLS
jgi:Arc/MetJ-type ribon-helix-helix transcriptional regulator